MQALQRKLEAFEREVAAMGTKVVFTRTHTHMHTHPCLQDFQRQIDKLKCELIIYKQYNYSMSVLYVCVCLQVRDLNNECLRLSAAYPGSNAHAVTVNMERVQVAWESLQTATVARKRKLKASHELQKFLSSVSSNCTHAYTTNNIIL